MERPENLSDRELLLRLYIDTAIMKDRTEGLLLLYERMPKVETDVTWLKRTVFGAVPGTGLLLGLIVSLTHLFSSSD